MCAAHTLTRVCGRRAEDRFEELILSFTFYLLVPSKKKCDYILASCELAEGKLWVLDSNRWWA